MKTPTLAFIASLVVLQLFTTSQAAISCNTVLKNLTPCVSYLTGGGTPSKSCCSGVASLASAATSTADKKAACKCITSIAQGTKPNVAAAKALPKTCGITLPYIISPTMDCSKIT